MVTDESGVYYSGVFYGLSKDEKPTDVPNGSKYIEMDTSKVYLYDAEGSEWLEVGGS